MPWGIEEPAGIKEPFLGDGRLRRSSDEAAEVGSTTQGNHRGSYGAVPPQDGNGFVAGQRTEQCQILAQQDEALQQLSLSAERLNQTAQVINVELRDQQAMLEDLEQDIDRETERLNFVMRRMGRLLKTSDSRLLCLIIGLTVLSVVLLFLVIN